MHSAEMWLLALCVSVFFLGLCPGCEDVSWNSSSEALKFQARYCSRYCDQNGQLTTSNDCREPACYPCDCDVTCSLFGTCCPTEDLKELPDRSKSEFRPDTERFICDVLLYDSSKTRYFSISDCNRKFPPYRDVPVNEHSKAYENVNRLVDRCEKDTVPKTMDDVTPYSDMHSGIVFRNKFCALCNGYTLSENSKIDIKSVKIASPWGIQVLCDHYQNLYYHTSGLDFLSHAHKSREKKCKVQLKPPNSHFPAKTCHSSSVMAARNECHSPQQPLLESHCRKLPKKPYLTVGGYQNIFCYLCSENTSAQICPCTRSSIHKKPKTLYESPISILLGIHQSSNKNIDSKCLEKKIVIEFQGKCELANCSLGKLLSEDGKCTSALTQIRGLGYKLALTLVPTGLLPLPSYGEIKNLQQAVIQQLRLNYTSMQLKVNITTETVENSNEVLHSCAVEAYLVASTDLTRDEFENDVFAVLTSPWELPTNFANGTNITLLPSVIGHEMHVSRLESVTAANFANSTLKIYPGSQNITGNVHTNIWTLSHKFIDVTYSLLCPFVPVNISKKVIDGLNISFTFMYDGREIIIKAGPNVSLVNQELHICVDTFKRIIVYVKPESLAAVALYYLQVTCFVLSLVCLMLTLITYALFRKLRSLPGLNITSLCVSMVMAHASLLVTAEYGVRGRLLGGYCTFHAVLTHFSWVATFSWMNVCCIHMFLAFTSHTSPSTAAASDTRQYLRYCVYGFGVPFMFVALTLILSATLTSGSSIGYDATNCFFDFHYSILPIVLGLLLPLCVSVVSNGVLFTMTLREMVHIASIQKATTKVERQGVKTYVKLSTLTGVFCLVAAMGVWLDSLVLQFLTAPLMALQGVFIFFSFIVNQRVRKMYIELLGCQPLIPASRDASTQSTSLKNGKNDKKRPQLSSRLTNQSSM